MSDASQRRRRTVRQPARRATAGGKPRRLPPPLSIALTWLRERRIWTRGDLAEATGISKNQISDYERDNRNLNRDRLEEFTAAMGYGLGEIELVMRTLSRIGVPLGDAAAEPAAEGPPGPPPEIVRLGEQAALHLAVELATLVESFWLPPIVTRQLAEDRTRADRLWQRLTLYPPSQRRALVEHTLEYRTWALAERLAQESRRAGRRSAQAALELARLAVTAARLAAGSDAWRRRLGGYARASLANAFHLVGDLNRSRAEWDATWQLWQDGAAGDPAALLPAWHLHEMEASLRRDAGDFDGALDLLEHAAAAAPRPAAGRLLLKRAAILEQTGDVAGAVMALRQAVPLAVAASESRLPLVLEFNLTLYLCQLAAFDEAAARLPDLRQRTLDLGDELDLLRVSWLSGRVEAGLGHGEEACAVFEQVRCQWMARRAALEAAVVSLELAVLHLEAGRPDLVCRLAQEMTGILAAPALSGEPLASLRRFCDAARRQAATIEQARTLLGLLDRSDHQLRTTATRLRLPRQKPA